jgi:hypothetical protein
MQPVRRRGRSRRLWLASTLRALLVIVVLESASPAGTARAAKGGPRVHELGAARGGSCGVWTLVTGANHGSDSSGLTGVSAISTGDVWAVGNWYDGSVFHTLTEHWNGAAWTIQGSPDVGAGTNSLQAVDALASDDAWAVGFSVVSGVFRTLVEHWNGMSWAVIPSANRGAGQNVLEAVAALSADDVWAVGYREVGSVRRTLTEHWNGRAWSVVKSPNIGVGENFLWSVAGVSAGDVWAVGQHDIATGGVGALAERWNGSGWSAVPSVTVGSNSILYGVTAPAPKEVRAVGSHLGNDGINRTLAEGFDGSSWSVARTPSPGSPWNALWAVASSGADDSWAVGDQQVGFGQPFRTLAEHWDGMRWRATATPNASQGDNHLYAVTNVPTSSQYWAVGRAFKTPTDSVLIEHRC